MSGVSQVRYDRARLSVGVVHFGVGGFHRAQQAMFHDRLMADRRSLQWAICGVGAMSSDRRVRDALEPRQCRYALVVTPSKTPRLRPLPTVPALVYWLGAGT